MLIHCTYKSAV